MSRQWLRNRFASCARQVSGVAMLLAIAAGAVAAADLPQQVEYLPRDGAALVRWQGVENATGYNVFQQVITDPAEIPAAGTKVNATPVTGTELLVENLQNGTPYHFRVSAIVGGQETEAQGPPPAEGNGFYAPVVPQKPTKLGERDFYGLNIGTDFPGSHEIAADGAITVKASGRDIYSSADGFYFLATPIEGDVTVTARVVSGPTAAENSEGWEQGGPMIREALVGESRMAITAVMRTHEIQYKVRKTEGETPVHALGDRGDNERRPVWLRIVRKGNTFTSFHSEDGTTFTQIGDPITVEGFAKTAYVGLAFSGHGVEGEYNTIVYDNFTVTAP